MTEENEKVWETHKVSMDFSRENCIDILSEKYSRAHLNTLSNEKLLALGENDGYWHRSEMPGFWHGPERAKQKGLANFAKSK
jgi:hypothetical protein